MVINKAKDTLFKEVLEDAIISINLKSLVTTTLDKAVLEVV